MGESDKIPTAKFGTARFGIGLMVLGAFSTLILSLIVSIVASPDFRFLNFTPKEGISVFAVAYLQAQFIERIIEPFSETKRTDKKRFGDTKRIKELEYIIATKKRSGEISDEEKKEADKESEKRVYGFWGLTSLLGMILAYFTVGLFETVGAKFIDLDVLGMTLPGRTWDAILSGVIVGAGTKPLHDLIGYIEKQKKKE